MKKNTNINLEKITKKYFFLLILLFTFFINCDPPLSDKNEISALVVNDGVKNLNATIASTEITFDQKAVSGATEVTIKNISISDNATSSKNTNDKLNVGTSTIVVTAENNSQKTYNLTIQVEIITGTGMTTMTGDGMMSGDGITISGTGLLGCMDPQNASFDPSGSINVRDCIASLEAQLPDINSLFYQDNSTTLVSGGQVLLYLQGGPSPFLDTDDINDFEPRVNVVYVHQAQTLYPSYMRLEEKRRIMSGSGFVINFGPIASATLLTPEQALGADLVSIAILEKVRKHFAANNNYTILALGHSLGAFLLNLYISIMPNENQFVRLASAAGRLKTPENLWMNFKNGSPANFGFATSGHCLATNLMAMQVGDNVMAPTEVRPDGIGNIFIIDQNAVSFKSGLRLQAALGEHIGHATYSQFNLERTNQWTNMLFVQGRLDMAIGAWTTDEVALAESIGARVCQTNSTHNLSSFNFAGNSDNDPEYLFDDVQNFLLNNAPCTSTMTLSVCSTSGN